MIVLVNGLSVRSLSGEHVLLGHLRQLAGWTLGAHTFLLLHDRGQTSLLRQLPANVRPACLSHSLASWSRRIAWETLLLPRLLRRWHVDMIFTTSGTVLPRCRVPQVSLAQNPWCMVRRVHKGVVQKQKAVVQRYAYRQAMSRAALMIYNSGHMQELYRENAGGAIEQASQVVYQAVDDSAHRQAARLQERIAKQPGLILCVSAMASWKGIEVLVDALALLHRRGCRAGLRLVGPWPDKRYETMVRERIATKGLGDYVSITGKVTKNQLYRHYARAKVYCLMSHCESFGIPAVEAQAFGTPVVGSSVCAMPEICGPGGAFCRPDDTEQTADLLQKLLEDSAHWIAMSDRARKNAARFRWRTCSRPLLKMFQSARPNEPEPEPPCQSTPRRDTALVEGRTV